MDVNDFQASASNLRPIAILTSYMSLCVGLTALTTRNLYLKARPRPLHKVTAKPQGRRPSQSSISRSVIGFSSLSVLSLAITWYYMFSFFHISYRSWATRQLVSMSSVEIGRWLKDTQLFKEAWGTAVATPARFWWTQQIFFFTAIWSVFLGSEGNGRNISHLWAFMLLGQVVAISFASNLFFLAVLLSPATHHDQSSSSNTRNTTWTPPIFLYIVPLAITMISVAAIPYSWDSSMFLAILAAPHLLLFIPTIIHQIVPHFWINNHQTPSKYDRFYRHIYCGTITAAVLLQAKITVEAIGQNGTLRGVLSALYDHPAVSSVGWDVILCWISWSIWILDRQGVVGEEMKQGNVKSRGTKTR